MVDVVGGKNASLGEIATAGAPVPPGFAATTAFYRSFVESDGIDEFVAERLAGVDPEDTAAVEAASADVTGRIESAPLPADLADAVERAWFDLHDRAGDEELAVAVRSSATTEDLPDASFAGQHDTFLHVTDLESVVDRIRACMASLYTPRAIAYRATQGIDQTTAAISVGVQEMVDPAVSGVMFTLNPSNGDRSKVRVESAWGLGEAVVDGSVTPDAYLVDKPTATVVERSVGEKAEKVVPTADGVETVRVPEDERTVDTLEDREIEVLTDLGKTLERHFGTPQDVEWAIDRSPPFPEGVFVVQSRPETTWD